MYKSLDYVTEKPFLNQIQIQLIFTVKHFYIVKQRINIKFAYIGYQWISQLRLIYARFIFIIMNSKMRFALFIVVLLVFSNSQEVYYKKVIHNTDSDAKCLDGSPPFLYIHQGAQKDKFLLYLIGGGFCGEATLSATLQSCYKRSKTELGGSGFWPDYINDSLGTQGLISLNETLYKNWTKVLFGYCDGAMMQGGNDSPILYKDTKLYFRGGKIMRSHFSYLINTYQMDKASKILLSGGSAGGLASIAWGNYLQSLIRNPSAVYIVPDSGLFINTNTYKDNVPLVQQQISTLMQIAQASQKSPLPECNVANPGQEWKCLMIEESHKYITGKYLFVNSQYDEWAISNIMKIKCLKKGTSGQTLQNCSNQQMNAIQDYRNKYIKFINQNIAKRGWGMWSIACSQHVYQVYKNMYDVDQQRVPMKVGLTVKDAMEQFVMNDKVLWTVDSNPWPSNEGCAF